MHGLRRFRRCNKVLAAGFLVCGDKVEMVSGNVDSVHVSGEAEAHEGPANILQFKFSLMLQSFFKARIRLLLARHAPDL